MNLVRLRPFPFEFVPAAALPPDATPRSKPAHRTSNAVRRSYAETIGFILWSGTLARSLNRIARDLPQLGLTDL